MRTFNFVKAKFKSTCAESLIALLATSLAQAHVTLLDPIARTSDNDLTMDPCGGKPADPSMPASTTPGSSRTPVVRASSLSSSRIFHCFSWPGLPSTPCARPTGFRPYSVNQATVGSPLKALLMATQHCWISRLPKAASSMLVNPGPGTPIRALLAQWKSYSRIAPGAL